MSYKRGKAIVTCPYCQTTREVYHSWLKNFTTCGNPECKSKHRSFAHKQAIAKERTCILCDSTFMPSAPSQKACASCMDIFHKMLTEKSLDKRNFGGNRLLALKRDGFHCQKCGTDSDLCVHHIDGNGSPRPIGKKNNDLSNLQTLCRSCHNKLHVEQEKEFFRQLVRSKRPHLPR